MSEFKEKIPAAGGKVEFLYDEASGGIAAQVSGTGIITLYQVAISMDGRRMLSTVPATGIGVTAVYPMPQFLPSSNPMNRACGEEIVLTVKNIFAPTILWMSPIAPTCALPAPDLAFVSKDQRKYITACYDAFARAYTGKKSTVVEIGDITDNTPAWHYSHYSEEKQQFHFKCSEKSCDTQTDILGQYGYCPRCGRTNARKLFLEHVDQMLVSAVLFPVI